MGDYKVGYGQPPKATRFQPGKSGNPKGRPKYTPPPYEEIVEEVMGARMQYRENGQVKTATRREVAYRLLADRAVKGDIRAAELLIEKRRHAARNHPKGARRLVITDWLPDFPGQTGDQKTEALQKVMPEQPKKPGKRGRGRPLRSALVRQRARKSKD